MKDIDYDEIDPGIRETVRLLRSWGLDTTDSGDGRSKSDWIADGEALDQPHVYITCHAGAPIEEQAADLWGRLVRIGIAVQPVGGDGVSIQATYDPVDDSAVIMLFGLDDDGLP